MAVISKNLNWVISANTSGFTRAVLASRSEAAALKRVLSEVKDPLADWTEAEKRLTTILKDSTITEDQRAAAMARLQAQHPAAIAAAREQAQAERDAQAVISRNRTEREKYNEAVTKLAGLKAGGQFAGDAGMAAYRSELERLKQMLPEVRARQDEAAKSQAAANRAAQEAQQIVARNRTAEEVYGESVRRLNELRQQGLIPQQAYQRELQRLQQTLPAVQARQEAAARAQAEANRVQQAGRALMVQYQSPLAAYRQRLGELNQMLAAGAINQRTFNRALADAKGQAFAQFAGVSGIPVLGDLAGKAAGLVALHPALAGVALGLGAATAGFRLAGDAAGFMRDQVAGQWEQITKIGEAAKQTGVSARFFGVFAQKAKEEGESVESLQTAMQKWNQTLGDSVRGNEEARKAISGVGLSWKELAGLQPEQAFLKVSAAIRELPTHAQRVSAAVDVMGRGAGGLLEVVALTRDEFQGLEADLTRRGKLFSDADAAGVKEAQIALARVNESATDLWRTFSIQVAPWVKIIADDLRGLLESREVLDALSVSGGMLGDVLTGLGWTFDRVNQSLDILRSSQAAVAWTTHGLLAAQFKLQELASTDSGQKQLFAEQVRVELMLAGQAADESNRKLASWATGGNDAGQKWATGVAERVKQFRAELEATKRDGGQIVPPDAGKGVADFTTKLDDQRRKLQEQVDTYGATAAAAEQYRLTQEALRNGAIASVGETLNEIAALQNLLEAKAEAAKLDQDILRLGNSLQEQIDTWGMTAKQIEVWRLAQAGADETALNSIRAQQQQLAELEKTKKLGEEAKQLKVSLQSPEQKFQEQIARYREMLQAAEITQDEFVEAFRKAHAELSKGLPDPMRPSGVQGVRFGTAAAQDRVEQLRGVERQQLRIAQQARQAMGQVPGRGVDAAPAPPAKANPAGAAGLAGPEKPQADPQVSTLLSKILFVLMSAMNGERISLVETKP